MDPRTRAQTSLFYGENRVFIEDFELSDRFYGTHLFDGDLSFFPVTEFSQMKSYIRFRLFPAFSKMPKTKLSHFRLGNEAENSQINFSRNFLDMARLSFGGNFDRGCESLSFSTYESQKGYLSTSFPLFFLSAEGFAVHNFERQGHKDSLPFKTSFDLASLTLRKSFFGVRYKYFFFNRSFLLNSFSVKTMGTEFFVEFSPSLSTQIKLFSTAEISDTETEKEIYSAGLSISREIFRLARVWSQIEIKSDSSFNIDVNFSYRPDLTKALYAGGCYLKRNHPVFTVTTDSFYATSHSAAYAGFRHSGKHLKLDFSAGYSFELSRSIYGQNMWKDKKEDPYFFGAFLSIFSPVEYISVSALAFSDTAQRICAFSTLSKSLFEGDLDLSFSAGTVASHTEKWDYYPFFSFKSRIINLFMDWRIQFDEEDYTIDYGVVWLFTN
ncbi:hypothetical protein JXA84_04855 [candidate division WOR-3 bacterium]|nr:hypothetical protein [candidate division WOR-3 bacterium]